VIEHRELVVIGAGPAGMQAAITASGHGAEVLVLDERSDPGGQIYRNVERPALRDARLLGEDYAAGAALAARFRGCGAEHRTGALVWEVSRDRIVRVAGGEGPRAIRAHRIVVATGALERPFPVPGWTLPGVMAAGGAQALLKEAALVPAGQVVLAGTGALLLLLAGQLLRLGVPIAALLETTPRGRLWRSAPRLPAALSAGDYVAKGLRMLGAIRTAGIPHVRGVESLRAEGDGRVERVVYRVRGREERLPADLLLLHQGVVPDIHVTRSLGCAHDWDAGQLCFRPRTDAWGSTDIEGVAVAGDAAGIVGAASAMQAGQVAGLETAHRLGHLTREERERLAAAPRAALARSLRVRPFLEGLHRPTDAHRVPPADDVVVCRCEEVRAGTVRAEIARGVRDPNALKSRTRCGMGPCQGRYCGLTVTEMLARGHGLAPQAVGYFRIRPPLRPVPMADLLALDSGEIPPEAALPGTGAAGGTRP